MANITQCAVCGTDLDPQSATGACPQCTAAAARAENSEQAAAVFRDLPRHIETEPEQTQRESFPDVIHADQFTEAMPEPSRSASLSPGLPPSLSGYMIIGPPRRGGMGTVWPAKQLGTRRTVAIKVLGAQHLTTAGRARFVREVELSAQLQHPNIARIYDSGVHQGDYFYAMELIDGLPLDQYVANNRCDQKQILELMRLVCQAVQHAHVRGVMHCDLKPANILVTQDGQPHVLDFGLARLTTTSPDGITENGSAPGTPSYMSPEQAAGQLEKIDIRTDVYSLGKILYQLLTGQLPHRREGPIADVLRRIATEEVRHPREVSPKLDRELCTLLLKALHRDPERRYSSAGELARDIDHFQRGEPLAAMPASTIYLLRKRMARHRLLLSAVGAALLVVAVMAVYSYIKVSQEAAKAQAVHDLLRYVLERIDPKHSGGRDVTAEILAGADSYLGEKFPSNPKLEADIRDTIGMDLLSLGQYTAAESQFQRAVDLRRKVLGNNKPATLSALRHLAEAHRERGKLQEAVDVSQQVVDACQGSLGPNDRQTLWARITLTYVLNDLGRGREAEAPVREALRRAKQHYGERDDVATAAAAALVLVLRDLGDEKKLAEAEELGRQTLRIRRIKPGMEHPDTIQSMHDLGTVLSMRGSLAEAEKLYRDALAIGDKLLARPLAQVNLGGATHPDLLIWKSDLAFNLSAQGQLSSDVSYKRERLAEAERIYKQILPASLVSRGDSHRYNIALRNNLASVLVAQRQWREAERYYREIIEIQKSSSGDERLEPLQFKDALASVLSAQGLLAEAVAIYTETLEERRKALAPDDPRVIAAAKNLETARAYHAAAREQSQAQENAADQAPDPE